MILLEANNKNDLNPVLLTAKQPAAPVGIEAVTNGEQLLRFQLSESDGSQVRREPRVALFDRKRRLSTASRYCAAYASIPAPGICLCPPPPLGTGYPIKCYHLGTNSYPPESASFHDFVKATAWIASYRDKINQIPPVHVT